MNSQIHRIKKKKKFTLQGRLRKMRFRRANPLFSCGRIYRIHKILASKYRAIAGYSNCCFPFLTRRELHVRACSHAGGRGPQVGEVTRLSI